MINEYPINHKPINVRGPWTTSDEIWYGGVSGTLKTAPETYTATRNWFVALTPSAPPDPDDPDIPEGAIGISTIEELQLIGNDAGYPLDGYYYWTGNIDASNTVTWDDGKGFGPIGSPVSPFTGTLDGLGYAIENLYINRTGVIFGRYIGLVGFNQGIIKNTSVTGAVVGTDIVGGLCGANAGTITASGTDVTVTSAESQAGGLCGLNVGIISQCKAAGSVTGIDQVGGLIGNHNSGGTIGANILVTNCYATGAVTGDNIVGGLVGVVEDGDMVTNCYATGAVTGDNIVGGLVGLVGSGTVTASYYDTTTTGQADNTGKGTPRTTAAMYQQATFTGWDFGVAWTIIEDTDYPRLKWEST